MLLGEAPTFLHLLSWSSLTVWGLILVCRIVFHHEAQTRSFLLFMLHLKKCSLLTCFSINLGLATKLSISFCWYYFLMPFRGILSNNNHILLNSNHLPHFDTHPKFSCLGLSLCSSPFHLDFHWLVLDHLPLLLFPTSYVTLSNPHTGALREQIGISLPLSTLPLYFFPH